MTLERAAACLCLLALVGVVGTLVVMRRYQHARLTPWPGVRRESRTPSFALQIVGLAFLAAAIVGLPLGPSTESEARTPRDLVIVLDLSRSMSAEQPSRLEKGVRALRSLADTIEQHGEARIGVVAFAARPELIFPLTADVGHLRHVIERVLVESPPGIRPEGETPISSGTRIGAAVRLALASLTLRPAGTQELLLVSDGDDPADDDEWQIAIAEGRSASVPIHVVAPGEPGIDATIPYRGDVLRFDDQVVRSRVQTDRLEEIARRTGGRFFAASKGTLSLGPNLHAYWRTLPPPTDVLADAGSALAAPTMHGPLLLAAFLCWLASGIRLEVRRFGLPAIALLLVGGRLDNNAESWLRHGNDAFLGHDFDEALRCYRLAATTTPDPGAAAFDAGSAHFRKEQFAEAAAAFRQALDDDGAPPERRARAWYDLGAALLHEAADRPMLEEAMDAYRHCLAASPDEVLRRDAIHNLEIAGRRWLKARPRSSDPGNDPAHDASTDSKQKSPSKSGTPREDGSSQPTEATVNDPDSNASPAGKDGNKAARGPITVLPDHAERVSLSSEEAAIHLERALGRITRDRLQHAPVEGPLRGRDW